MREVREPSGKPHVPKAHKSSHVGGAPEESAAERYRKGCITAPGKLAGGPNRPEGR
jgi:hypothetical protein